MCNDAQNTCFHVGKVSSQCYLLAFQPDGSAVSSVCLKLTSRATTNVLEGSASDDPEGMLADTPAHALLSYFYYIFEKVTLQFPACC